MKRSGVRISVFVLTVLLAAAFGGGTLAAAPKNLKEMTAFTIAGIPGTIEDTTISVDLTTLPLFTRVDALVATFKTNGKAVRVGSRNQVNGKTPNDFTKPVVYTVAAADGSTATYTVRVLLGNIVSISGYADTLMVGSDGSLWGTGRNGDGQLGIGNTSSVSVPKQILPNGVAAVAAGYYDTLIVLTDGSLWATGYS